MDQNNDWYERYSSNRPSEAAAHTVRREHRGIRGSTLVICMLVAVLLGGLLGGLYTRQYVGEQIAALQEQQAQTALASSSSTSDSTDSTTQDSASDALTSTSTNSFSTSTYTKAQIIEMCAPSVVGIDTYVSASSTYGFFYGNDNSSTSEEVQYGSGSGIILTSDGYIVTCKHVVEDVDTIKVILNDDTEYEATLVGTDSRSDLAVLKIDATGLTPATLGDSDMLTVGEDVIAIGNPLGELRGTATSGIVSALSREVTVENVTMSLIQTDAAISPGNSGGGLFNSSGSLIGIVNAKASSDDAEGLGFAIPVSSVKTIISNLIDHGYVLGRAYLGVYTQDVTLSSGMNDWGGGLFGNYYSSGGTSCVQIAQIVSGSAAETAGLQVGDLILAVDDTEISSNTALSAAISEYNAGDTATLTIQRDGQQQTVTVTFGEYTPES
ncbi:MAG TPA: trypsin-like peptidase domain-containing protein [Eubacteriales bacterium]|nr:trypsin-like peptidase domain-containing protein [Eubacteriales bacterium]